MPGKQRSRAQIERDRRRIADLYLQGWLQVDIAEELGVTTATVSRDLTQLHDEWQHSSLMDFNEARSQELARIDRLEREYWLAWARSLEDSETLVQEGVMDATRQLLPKKVVKTAKGSVGDARFLAGVQWCIAKRCEILGLDAMAKAEITWKEEIIALLQAGKVTPAQVRAEIGDDLAGELFIAAGIPVVTAGTPEQES